MSTVILTTCKGRRRFLEQTVPTWLEHTPFNVLVVDYGCPDNVARWANCIGDRVRGLTVSIIDGEHGGALPPKFFNRAKAVNAGLDALWREHFWTRYERVLIMDADTRILKPLSFTGKPDEIRFVRPAPGRRDLTGLLAADFDSLMYVGGPNTTMEGWGVDDIDLRLRLYLRENVRVSFFDDDQFEAIPHDDDIRVEHYAEKDRRLAVASNFQIMWNSLTRAEFERVSSGGPDIEQLLGSASAKP